ncbi:MAG: SRPBCC domain-containing protein [Beijerinckiaceae bacterium]|nr:SRPBCC domain-containing protein [Beijerinckiaceae bacterium]
MAIVFTQVDIAAEADDIWAILTEFDAYPAWNPVIRRVSAKPDGGLAISLHPPGQIAFVFRMRVIESRRAQRLIMDGHCLFPRFLDWRHQIDIETAATVSTLRQTARFTGHLIKPTPNFMMRPVRNAFARMNEAVRDMAEARRRAD